jgi:CheY-like chemotaxis protein
MSSVLLVEDNPMNRVLASEILKRRGHRIIEAANVGEAIDCLRSSVPDIVLLDIQIPGGGGELVLRHIRDEPRLASLVVVAVTAYSMRGDRERILALGFDGYVSKPIDTRRFGPDVECFLEKGRSER